MAKEESWKNDCPSCSQANSVKIIQNLEPQVVPLLEAYLEKHQKLPAHIIYYRSGLNERVVRDSFGVEISAIQDAFKALGGSTRALKISAVIVSKQETVRFFPLSPEASALPKADRISDHESNESSCNRPFVVGRIMGNAQPGLVVDSEITSAYSHDFYLQSHGATAGTARPTHYRVAFDQNKLSADDIQHLVSFVDWLTAKLF